jgi:hypothetical protein
MNYDLVQRESLPFRSVAVQGRQNGGCVSFLCPFKRSIWEHVRIVAVKLLDQVIWGHLLAGRDARRTQANYYRRKTREELRIASRHWNVLDLTAEQYYSPGHRINDYRCAQR